MKDTKKITQGAMLIAIAGALMLIDRMTQYLFSTFIVLAIPVVIIVYCCMHTMKDGAVFSCALLIVSIMLGLSDPAFTYIIYVPIGVVVGLIYANGVKKHWNKKVLMLISMIVYIIGEVLSACVIFPIMGISISTQINEIEEMMNSIMSMAQTGMFPVGINVSTIIVISFFLAIILLGVMEGLILHILSVFILQRLKIAEIYNGSILKVSTNKALAYICCVPIFATFFINRINNEYYTYTVIALAAVATIILAFYGYIFVILYSRIVLQKNVSIFIVLLTILFLPLMTLIFAILGFLYCSGPLYSLLLEKGMKK